MQEALAQSLNAAHDKIETIVDSNSRLKAKYKDSTGFVKAYLVTLKSCRHNVQKANLRMQLHLCKTCFLNASVAKMLTDTVSMIFTMALQLKELEQFAKDDGTRGDGDDGTRGDDGKGGDDGTRGDEDDGTRGGNGTDQACT